MLGNFNSVHKSIAEISQQTLILLKKQSCFLLLKSLEHIVSIIAHILLDSFNANAF